MRRIPVRPMWFVVLFAAILALPVLAGAIQDKERSKAGIAPPTASLSANPDFRAKPPQRCESPAVLSEGAKARPMRAFNSNGPNRTAPWSKVYAPAGKAVAPGPTILLYADDYYHQAPNTFVDQALQYWGYGYTAHYDGDFSGFVADLTGGTAWDLVIFAQENYSTDSSVFDALNTYALGGGRLIFQTWQMGGGGDSYAYTYPLFQTLGFNLVESNYDPPWNTYWWDFTHPFFTTPMTVPQFTSLTGGRYGTYGGRGDADPGFTAVAGYVSGQPTAIYVPGYAALVVGNGGRTIFKAFLDGQNDANLNGNEYPDGAELWINMIGGIFGCPGAPVNDGSFENGPPPASAWTEWTSTGCEWIGDMSGIWGIPAHEGVNVFWAGGYCDSMNSDYVEQSITLPASSLLKLKFWTVFYRPDADDATPDTFYVNVNGAQVFAKGMIQANDTYPNWVQEEVDLTAYQGQTVTLRIGADSQGSSTGNVLLDDLSLSVCPVICPTISVFPYTLPTPTVGVPYTQVFSAYGGTEPYTFTVTAGTLPPGLTLAADGTLSGTLTSLGDFSFTVTATDANGCTGEQSYSMATWSAYFLDDQGRSKLCVNRLTGDYIWEITTGPGMGTYTGVANIINGGTKIYSKPGADDYLNCTYDAIKKRAAGYYITAAGDYSALKDYNTTNNVGGCFGGEQNPE